MKFTATKLLRLMQLTNKVNRVFPLQPVRSELIVEFDANFAVLRVVENTLLASAGELDEETGQFRFVLPRYPHDLPLSIVSLPVYPRDASAGHYSGLEAALIVLRLLDDGTHYVCIDSYAVAVARLHDIGLVPPTCLSIAGAPFVPLPVEDV